MADGVPGPFDPGAPRGPERAFQLPPDRWRRWRKWQPIAGVVVTVAIFVALLFATRGHAWRTRRTRGATATTTTAPLVDRTGAPIDPNSLTGLEAACRQRGGGQSLCRCVRLSVPTLVERDDIVKGTIALLAGKSPPERVQAIIKACNEKTKS
jgi:hypothetical protein